MPTWWPIVAAARQCGYNKVMRIDLPSGTPAELVPPDGPPRRGVVVYPDIYGLRPLFDALASRLAAEHSWAVCAVEPFPGQHLETIEERFDAVARLDDGALLRDAVAARDVLTGQGCQRVSVLGFCMGGMYTLKAAASGRFDRAVAFYGMIRLPVMWRGPGQAEPLDVLREATVRSHVLAIIGAQDPYTPPEDVAQLAALGPDITIASYPDAEHGFVHDPERPAHRPGDAADAWAKAVAFLG